MNELFREFFYEGINRILPGTVVIFLYARAQVFEALKGSHEQAIITFFLTAVAAWLTGLILEVCTYCFPMLSLKVACRCTKWQWPNRLYKFLSPAERLYSSETSTGRMLLKAAAEKGLCRDLSFFSFYTLINYPTIPPQWNLGQWHWWDSAAGAAIFFIAWFWGFRVLKNLENLSIR